MSSSFPICPSTSGNAQPIRSVSARLVFLCFLATDSTFQNRFFFSVLLDNSPVEWKSIYFRFSWPLSLIIFNRLLLIHGFLWMYFCFRETVYRNACFSIISVIKLTSCLKLFSTTWEVIVVCIRSYVKGIRAASKSWWNFLSPTAYFFPTVNMPSWLFDLLMVVEILHNIG